MGQSMFKSLRKLKISLAVKCQLLFGAAVVLIIAAALYVPWQRMQQLTDQLNDRAAAAVATNVVAEHVERATEQYEGSVPAPTTQDAQERDVVVEGRSFAAPRIIGPQKLGEPGFVLSRFEKGALNRFITDRDKAS